MVLLANAKEAAEGHHRISDLAGVFVDHQVMHLSQALTFRIVDGSALHLVRGDQTVGLVGCQAACGRGCRIIHLVNPLSRRIALTAVKSLPGTGSGLRRLFATAAGRRSSATAPSAPSAGSS